MRQMRLILWKRIFGSLTNCTQEAKTPFRITRREHGGERNEDHSDQWNRKARCDIQDEGNILRTVDADYGYTLDTSTGASTLSADFSFVLDIITRLLMSPFILLTCRMVDLVYSDSPFTISSSSALD